jgi:hypothetical protein
VYGADRGGLTWKSWTGSGRDALGKSGRDNNTEEETRKESKERPGKASNRKETARYTRRRGGAGRNKLAKVETPDDF